MRGGYVRAAAGSALLIGLVVLGACSEDRYTVCPSYDVGAVEGFVTMCGEPVAVEIGARPMEGMQAGDLMATTESDETGWYRFELPGGLYQISVDPHEHYLDLDAPGDTVRITTDVARLDLRRGQAEIRVDLPTAMEGTEYWLRVLGDDHPGFNERFLVEDGSITAVVPYLPPGPYVMRLRGRGLEYNLYLPGTFDIDEADTLAVTTDSTATYGVDLSDRFAFVSGRVTGSWQVAGSFMPRVRVYTVRHQRMDEVLCDEDGAFTLAVLAPAQVRLLLAGGYVERWYGGESFDEATTLSLAPGDHVTGIDMEESGFELQISGPGHYLDHEYDLLIRHEDGRTYDYSWGYGSWIEVHNLDAGRYAVGVRGLCRGQPWREQWFDGAASQADATLIDLAPDAYPSLEMTLELGGRIAGELREADGELPNGSRGQLHDLDGEALCYNWLYFHDGQFDFTGLADGSYLMSVDDDDGDWWYPGTYDLQQATVIEIVDQGEVTGLSWRLPGNGKEGHR